MKVSKVDHIRSAVAKKQPDSVGGILYVFPSKSTPVDIDRHIGNVLNKRRYSPFNQPKPASDDKKELLEIAKIINFGRKISEGMLAQYKNNRLDISGIVCNKVAVDTDFENLLDVCRAMLKRTLCRTINHRAPGSGDVTCDIPLLFAKLIAAKLGIAAPHLTAEEYRALAEIVYEDKYKMHYEEKLKKSIEGNNVRVQVDNTGDEPLLVLPGGSSSLPEKKKEYSINKKAMFDYIKHFVSLDAAGQDDEVRDMRCLVLLFVCGPERYELAKNSGNLTAWGWGGWLPPAEEIFNKDAFDNWTAACIARNAKNNKLWKEKILSVRYFLEQSITKFFRQAAPIVKNEYPSEVYEQKLYWLNLFQKIVERKLRKDNSLTNVRFTSVYLCRTVFREWLAFMASKIVDIGKGVYHFAMPKEYDLAWQDNVFGKVRDEYLSGITSFDYERIKAEENLKRDLSVSATYAAAVFGYNAITVSARRRSGKEDALFYSRDGKNNNSFSEFSRPDAVRRLLQFFGGKSCWADAALWENKAADFLDNIKNPIKIIRNSNFHYAASPTRLSDSSANLAKNLLKQEYSRLKDVYTGKYYSNNVPMFYREADIIKLLNHLYRTDAIAEAQIPAFRRIFLRKDFPDFTQKLGIETTLSKYNVTPEILEKYRSAVYFVLKEIYYRDFIIQKNLAEVFRDVVKNYHSDEREKYPWINFKRRLDGLPKSFSFAAICQQLMMDINMQNQGEKSVRTIAQKAAAKVNGHKEKYSHFKMLLYKIIEQMFIDFLKESPFYKFLAAPVNFFDLPQKISNNDYCKALAWQPDNFSFVKNILADADGEKDNTVLLSWYITAHFLPSKQLNELKGSIKSYLQYVKNINNRAASIGNRCGADEERACAYYGEILSVLDFVAVFNGRISNIFTDYFSSEEDYCKHLQVFFEQETGKNIEGPGELFFDEYNPKINRGVVLSSMYGLDNIFTDIGYKITEDYYNRYKKLAASEDIIHLCEKLRCENEDDQKNVLHFQQMKNRIELQDLLQYVGMIMDHMAQLVSYAYFRERDMMYFQLGIHYLRLYHCPGLVPVDDCQRKIMGKDISIKDGAILYAIVATYDFDLSAIEKKNDNSYQLSKDKSIESKQKNLKKLYGEEVFASGLQLFEKRSCKGEHTGMYELRNDIDHLKFITACDKSIMDFYSEIYNGFFRYDTKLKKSVSYIFKNIMARYLLNVELSFKEGSNGKRVITIEDISPGKNLYKLSEDGKNKKVSLPVRSDEFIRDVENLLNWKASDNVRG